MSEVLSDAEFLIRKKFLLDQAADLVREFRVVNGNWPKLKVLGALYGKAFYKLGLALKVALRSDPRFNLKMFGPHGGYVVELRGGDLVDLICEALSAGPLSREALLGRLSGSGFTVGDFMSETDRMKSLGALRTKDGLYLLPD